MRGAATSAAGAPSCSIRSSSQHSFRPAHLLALWMGAWALLAPWGTALAAPGDNVALGKPVTMSSDIGATASACTDGDTNGNFTVAQGCQTTAAATGANREWIEIDLGQNYIIERIVLWNRTDIAGASNWILTTSRPAVLAGALTAVPSSAFTNVGVNSLTYANGQAVGVPQGTGPGPNYSSLDLQAGTHTARYVRIYRLAASQALQLAEIQVIEGPPAVRTFTNSGFELPVIPGSSFAQRTESVVPGWSTTETNTSPSPYSAGGNIEIWSNGFLGVAAPEGLQFAELNAFNPAATLAATDLHLPGGDLHHQLSPSRPDRGRYRRVADRQRAVGHRR